jgi:hypothetical protein
MIYYIAVSTAIFALCMLAGYLLEAWMDRDKKFNKQ